MDSKRIFLYLALFLVLFILWGRWQEYNLMEQGEVVPSPLESIATPEQNSTDSFVPNITLTQQGQADESASGPIASEQDPTSVPAERLVHVKTDVLAINIDTLGGALVGAKLLDYQQSSDQTDNPYVLFNDNANSLYVAESGILQVGAQSNAPLQYNVDAHQYELAPGQEQLQVDLTWANNEGLLITQTYTFKRGSYLVDVNYHINNQSQQAWRGSVYNQLVRVEPTHIRSRLFDLSAYLGASISDPATKLYQKLSFKAMRKADLNQVIEGGWLAMQEHYFLTAWVPNSDQESRYYSNVSAGDKFTIGLIGPVINVAAAAEGSSQSELYIGPEITDVLKQIAPGLNLTVDYGWLWFISIFLFQILKYIHQIVGNWGWSIVIVTVLIKLVFYRLSARSYRSMANMRKLQPKLAALKERYAGDRAKFSQATMELYKKEKLNPFGGCLPILVQIPVFIALYWVLLESVELRHAPFILWIHDLSAKDPFYVLPILMGLTMFLQQKLSPTPPDPMQAKVMMFLPVFFTFLFLQFPAGLVLYWTVNNSLSISQQWYVMKRVEHGGTKKLIKKKKSL